MPTLALRGASGVAAVVTGGDATLSLWVAAVLGGVWAKLATSSANATSWASTTDAPWAAVQLRWASNTGTVAVDIATWE